MIEDLRNKINLARVLLKLDSDAAFARAIGVSPATLAGYMSDDQAAAGHVPPARLEAMARLIAEAASDRLTFEHAKLAWQSDLVSFQLAIAPYSSTAFDRLLAATPLTTFIELHLRGRDASRGLHDDEPADIDHDKGPIPAEARFDLEIRGVAGAQVVVLAQSMLGWHFAIPRSPEPVRIGRSGMVRAPTTGLRFPKEGGRYVFYAFVIDRQLSPSIVVRAGQPSPLNVDDLNGFAVELMDRAGTRSFALGRRAVFVETAR